MAQIAHEIGFDEKVAEWSQLAVQRDDGPTDERAGALALLSELQFQRNREAEALTGFEELTRIRRDARPWMFRGMIEQNLGRSDDAVRSLEMSVRINPFNPGAHSALSAVFESQRQLDKAQIHRTAAEKQIQSARQRDAN